MSRTGLSPSDIAESFRDECGDGSMDWVYTPMQTWLLLDAADMLEENAKLRDEFRKMDEWHSKELLAAIDENKKLRKLVRDMYACISHANEQDWFYFERDKFGCGMSCTVNGEACGLCALADRMRELGVYE